MELDGDKISFKSQLKGLSGVTSAVADLIENVKRYWLKNYLDWALILLNFALPSPNLVHVEIRPKVEVHVTIHVCAERDNDMRTDDVATE